MAKGRMTDIMPQGNGFGQIFVQPHGPGDGTRNLGDFQCMGKPGAVLIPEGRQKNLGFMFQPPEGIAVQNPVAVALKGGSNLIGLFSSPPPPALGAETSKGRHEAFFTFFKIFAYGHKTLNR